MRLNLDVTFSKLMNPRLSAGLVVLHSLLDQLSGPPVAPKEVREMVDMLLKERTVSKQSITNAARRLEELSLIDRSGESGYSVRFGYLISVMLAALIELTKRVNTLEDELETLKRVLRS